MEYFANGTLTRDAFDTLVDKINELESRLTTVEALLLRIVEEKDNDVYAKCANADSWKPYVNGPSGYTLRRE